MRVSRGEAVRVICRALDLGINFIDTATGYGDSEEKIGLALEGRRKGVVLATKSPAKDKKGMSKAINQSLRRLHTDHIDLYQCHAVKNENELSQILNKGGAIEALQEARKKGKIGHIGITSHSLDLIEKIVEKETIFETIQVPYNFIMFEPRDRLLPKAKENNIGFIGMKPLGGGILEDVRLSLRYALEIPEVVPIPGMETADEVEEDVRIAANPTPLSRGEQSNIERIRKRLGRRFCRKCEYCQPCPEGIVIHLALGAETLIGRFDHTSLIQGWCKEIMEKAASCTECGQCEDKCPYELPVRDILKEKVAMYNRFLEGEGAVPIATH